MGILNDIRRRCFPINYLGAIPRFFDLDPMNWAIDVSILADELSVAEKENRLQQ